MILNYFKSNNRDIKIITNPGSLEKVILNVEIKKSFRVKKCRYFILQNP